MKTTPFPGTLEKQPGRHGAHTYTLSAAQEAWMRRHYPVTENSRLQKILGISAPTLHRLARKLGLQKSPEGMKAIRKRTARRTSAMLERNGYYDSLRGKPVSPATVEGARRMWQEVREGKRESPHAARKRKNPRGYRRTLEKMSQTRQHLFREERRRDLFNLPRKTRLRLCLQPYTRSQVCRRYNALRRGYYVADDCSEGSGYRYVIFYDDATQRSAAFERNLLKDGFRVEPWREED